MVLRRSSRSASAKPPSAAAKPLSKSVPNSQTNGTKRPASTEPSMTPLPKRSRSESQKPENDPPVAVSRNKPNSRSAQPAKNKSRKLSPVHEAPPALKQLKPYFNPLPVPPQKQRPGLLPFVWGTGNFGQFGMGPAVLGEVSKPKRNTWIEEHIEAGAFGEDNAGIESVACGGLHTIFLDERGTVSHSQRSP
jgi:regulator of chromosome condensation